MAITTRYAVNMAKQYNEVTIDEFLINPSVGSRRFLTEAEQTRLLRATETSALYFLTDVSGQGRSARYRWYDSGGTILNEYYLSLSSAGVHNSIPIDWSSFYVPSGTVKMTVAIVNTSNGFANGDFSQGTGNLFTGWTLTQPSRTNILLRSQELSNASWGKTSSSITANTTIAPDGTTTADTLTGTGGTTTKFIQQNVTIGAGTYTFSFYAKYSTQRYIQVLVGSAGLANLQYTNVDLLTGTTADFNGAVSKIYTDENGFYRITFTFPYVDVNQVIILLVDSLAVARGASTSSTSSVILWGAQLEQSSQATPYVPTTSASVTTSLGEILQDATGGLESSRCAKVWASAGGTRISQSSNLVAGQTYKISFWAKVDYLTGSQVLVDTIPVNIISLDWKRYEVSYTAVGTGAFVWAFEYYNTDTYGFIYYDDINVTLSTPSELSEVRTFILDDSCVAYEYQLNWLNKRGGRDTWVMTGFPTEVVEVKRNNEIEYSQRTNYTSPNRIYGFRQNQTRKTITLSHQCKDRRTAEWLKSELIDSIDVLLLIEGDYYPCDVVPNSIVVRNTFSQDYTVRVTLRYAYDINVQTR